MRLLLFLLLAPVALAQCEFRELVVKGSIWCPPRPHNYIENFNVSLVRKRRLTAGGKVEVVDETRTQQLTAFTLKSPSIDPMAELGQYDYFLKVDRKYPSEYCTRLPKSVPLDWHKRMIRLNRLDLNEL